jgi:hypothetical protein
MFSLWLLLKFPNIRKIHMKTMVDWVLVSELTTSSNGSATFSLGCGKWNMGPFPIKISCLESQLSKTQNKWKWVHVVMNILTLSWESCSLHEHTLILLKMLPIYTWTCIGGSLVYDTVNKHLKKAFLQDCFVKCLWKIPICNIQCLISQRLSSSKNLA